MKILGRLRATVVGVAFSVVGLAACDDGPGGPREALATVAGDAALGAALLDMTWSDVESVVGRGDTQAYAAAVTGSPDRHRVILVHGGGGELRFSVQLSGEGGDVPAFTIVAAADTADQPLPVADLRVILDR